MVEEVNCVVKGKHCDFVGFFKLQASHACECLEIKQ